MKPEIEAAIVVPLGKRKVALIFLGSLAFVAGSIWMWSNADDFNRDIHRSIVKGAAPFSRRLFRTLCHLFVRQAL